MAGQYRRESFEQMDRQQGPNLKVQYGRFLVTVTYIPNADMRVLLLPPNGKGT